MAVALASSSSLAYGNRTNTTLPAPSGITDGDVLLAVMFAASDPGVTVTPPAGWTVLTGFPLVYHRGQPGYTYRLYAFVKVASGESGNYTFTHTTADSEGWLGRYTGASTSAPINPAPAVDTDTGDVGTNGPEDSGTDLNPGSITTEVDGSMVVFIGSTWDAADFTPPTGTTPTFTERLDGTALFVADGVMATAGNTGNKVVISTQVEARPNASALICIEAASGLAIDSVTPSTFQNGETGIVIAGSGF